MLKKYDTFMPKKPRLCPGDYIYHVLNRSNGGSPIFKTPSDYAAFENTLSEGISRMPMRLIAYCIMPNHWHLLLQPYKDGDLSSFLHWITVTHAKRWQMKHSVLGTGHLYQGRFKSFPVQGQYYFLTVLRYIEGNPLRAGLVTSSKEWLWSSLALRVGISKGTLALWPGPVPLPPDWADIVDDRTQSKYREKLEVSIKRGTPLGDDEWIRQTASTMNLISTCRPRGRQPKSK